MVDDEGFVTEGSSTNAWIVTREGALVTRQTDQSILPGVTRKTLIDVAAALGLAVEIRPFSVDEVFRAREAFFSSASTIVIPVVEIDGRLIGDGKPGEIALTLRRRFHEIAAKS
jgi:D-alanine transaminase